MMQLVAINNECPEVEPLISALLGPWLLVEDRTGEGDPPNLCWSLRHQHAIGMDRSLSCTGLPGLLLGYFSQGTPGCRGCDSGEQRPHAVAAEPGNTARRVSPPLQQVQPSQGLSKRLASLSALQGSCSRQTVRWLAADRCHCMRSAPSTQTQVCTHQTEVDQHKFWYI